MLHDKAIRNKDNPFVDIPNGSLLPGDILLYGGSKDPLGKLIHFGTNSPYSHVVVSLGGGMIAESEFNWKRWVKKVLTLGLFETYDPGPCVRDVQSLAKRHGYFDVYRSALLSTPESQAEFRMACLREINRDLGYDIIGLVWQAVVAAKIVFMQKDTKGALHSKRAYYCSEFERRIFELINRDPGDGVPSCRCTPATESLRPDVQFVGRLILGD